MQKLEMWAGLECTVNRVEDTYFNQLAKNGHWERESDLLLFAELGVKKIRYPFLWEFAASEDPNHFDWSWIDQRLQMMKELELTPIAGFLHHGSGPKHTSLIDPGFPEKFASYARAFAERYPWVCDFTPINEINTTARFSCLYGHWFPHKRDSGSYLTAVMLQCKATVLAMREIRKVNPLAKLIQTDDLGEISSTHILEYQRDFENERRWIAFDLLCGKITPDHPIYDYFINSGISPHDLQWFTENRCPPDVLGINHYHLSNRFLDHRLELYPEYLHGGNGTHQYADVGAIDTGETIPQTPEHILMSAWNRFHIPIAVTEVHVHGGREAQMRWVKEVWEAALSARKKGAQVHAITAWSLLGTYDWNSLCTKDDMFYESGVFDLSNPDRIPKPTALGRMIKELAINGHIQSPLLDEEGCWRTPRRILFAASQGAFSSLEKSSRPLIIATGAGSTGETFAKACGERNIHYLLVGNNELEGVIAEKRPWGIINAGENMRNSFEVPLVNVPASSAENCSSELAHSTLNLLIDVAH